MVVNKSESNEDNRMVPDEETVRPSAPPYTLFEELLELEANSFDDDYNRYDFLCIHFE